MDLKRISSWIWGVMIACFMMGSLIRCQSGERGNEVHNTEKTQLQQASDSDQPSNPLGAEITDDLEDELGVDPKLNFEEDEERTMP